MIADEYIHKKIFDIFTMTQPYQSLTFESEVLNQRRNALLYIHTDAIYCNILILLIHVCLSCSICRYCVFIYYTFVSRRHFQYNTIS